MFKSNNLIDQNNFAKIIGKSNISKLEIINYENKINCEKLIISMGKIIQEEIISIDRSEPLFNSCETFYKYIILKLCVGEIKNDELIPNIDLINQINNFCKIIDKCTNDLIYTYFYVYSMSMIKSKSINILPFGEYYPDKKLITDMSNSTDISNINNDVNNYSNTIILTINKIINLLQKIKTNNLNTQKIIDNSIVDMNNCINLYTNNIEPNCIGLFKCINTVVYTKFLQQTTYIIGLNLFYKLDTIYTTNYYNKNNLINPSDTNNLINSIDTDILLNLLNDQIYILLNLKYIESYLFNILDPNDKTQITNLYSLIKTNISINDLLNKIQLNEYSLANIDNFMIYNLQHYIYFYLNDFIWSKNQLSFELISLVKNCLNFKSNLIELNNNSAAYITANGGTIENLNKVIGYYYGDNDIYLEDIVLGFLFNPIDEKMLSVIKSFIIDKNDLLFLNALKIYILPSYEGTNIINSFDLILYKLIIETIIRKLQYMCFKTLKDWFKNLTFGDSYELYKKIKSELTINKLDPNSDLKKMLIPVYSVIVGDYLPAFKYLEKSSVQQLSDIINNPISDFVKQLKTTNSDDLIEFIKQLTPNGLTELPIIINYWQYLFDTSLYIINTFNLVTNNPDLIIDYQKTSIEYKITLYYTCLEKIIKLKKIESININKNIISIEELYNIIKTAYVINDDISIKKNLFNMIFKYYHQIKNLSYDLELEVFNILKIKSDPNIVLILNNLFFYGYETNLPIKEFVEKDIFIELNNMTKIMFYNYFFHIQFKYHNKIMILLVNKMNVDYLKSLQQIFIKSLGNKYVKLKYDYYAGTSTISNVFQYINTEKVDFLLQILNGFLNLISKNDINNLENIFNDFMTDININIINDMANLMSFNFANDFDKINNLIISSDSEYANYVNILKMSINLCPNITTQFDPNCRYNIQPSCDISFDIYKDYYKKNNEYLNKLINIISNETNQNNINDSNILSLHNNNIYNSLINMVTSKKTDLLNLPNKYEYISDILKIISSNNLSFNYVYFKNKTILECRDKDKDSDILINSLNELFNTIFLLEKKKDNGYVGNSKLKYKNNVVKNIVFCIICPNTYFNQNKIKTKINIMDEIGMFYCSYNPYNE